MKADRQTLEGGVVVTGGGHGIGRAIVLACARRGAAVGVLDLNADAAATVAKEAKAAGAPEAAGLECDVRSEDAISSSMSEASARLVAPLRGLVTSAGVDRGGLVHELDVEQWLDVLLTNLTGTFLTCKHGLVQMLEHGQGGAIVCVSSPWANVASAGGASAYCASKGGISAFVRSLALDYADYGIRVNGLLPGATDTDLMWSSFEPGEVPAARLRIGHQIPLGRVAAPEEIGDAAAWLLCDEARYVTGAHLTVDGGLLAKASIEA